MKTMILLLATLLSFAGCKKDGIEIKQDKSIITENATLYYYYDAGFGGSQCDYVIETLRGKIYTPKLYSKLLKIRSSNRDGSKTEIVISYRLTEDSVDRCYHKKSLNPETIVVEVISAKKR